MFEDGMCGYADESSGQLYWTSDTAANAQNDPMTADAPPIDYNIGTASGKN